MLYLLSSGLLNFKHSYYTLDNIFFECSPSVVSVVLYSNLTELLFRQLRRTYESCRQDKDNMVVKYAQAEQKNIELQDRMQKVDVKIRDWVRDRENIIGRMNCMKAEKQKIGELMENRVSDPDLFQLSSCNWLYSFFFPHP